MLDREDHHPIISRLNRTSTYVVIISVFLLAVNVSLGLVLTKQSSTAMRSLIESRMLDVSNTAAALLDGDTIETLQAEDRETPEYQSAYKILSCFEENIGLEYIYCVRDMGDGSFVFMIDPDTEDPGEFGEHIPFTDALYQASLGTPSVDKEPYQDNWGRFYSAYSPVFNSKNRVAGIVAVDFSAKWYENQISNHVRTTLLISGLSLLIAAVIIIVITTRYKRRFGTLFNEMNLVSDGIETLMHEASPGTEVVAWTDEDVVHSSDEIAELGSKIHSLQDRLSKQISYVRSQAYIDSLTGLGNRTAYEDHVHRLEEAIGAGKAAFAVALFDLNGLKEINDGYGHERGDQVIIEAASDLEKAFEGAQLYRIGGDEFVVILENADLDAMLLSAQRLDAQSRISISKGCAAYDPETDDGYRAVFNRADNAMYNDKRLYYLTHEDRRRY